MGSGAMKFKAIQITEPRIEELSLLHFVLMDFSFFVALLANLIELYLFLLGFFKGSHRWGR